MNDMEGRWGRRVFGSVTKGYSTVTFRLSMMTREKQIITQVIRVTHHDLEQYPELYGQTLDRMVAAIEDVITHTQGDQP